MNTCVQWYGADPVEGSVSMEIYRRSLMRARDPGDGYEVACWPNEEKLPRRQGKVARVLGKYVRYPARVRSVHGAALAHILDHSSSHLLPHIPKGTKKVVTLHDLIPLRFSGGLGSGQIRRYRWAVSKMTDTDAVIAVSEYSKKEAVELLGLDENKIFVIPNGVSAPADDDVESCGVTALRAAGVEVVVLSVGSDQERKNLSLLPEALKECGRVTGRKVGLLRVGVSLDRKLMAQLHDAVGAEGVFEAGRLQEKDLWAAYRGSDVVIVPSLYEGYGLPVMEAFGCGTAVACSNSSSLPEVGGEEAEYFSPHDGEAAGAALARCVADLEDGDKRMRRLEKAQQATWRKHLEGVYQVYDHVLWREKG